jgi:hypothetical protein
MLSTPRCGADRIDASLNDGRSSTVGASFSVTAVNESGRDKTNFKPSVGQHSGIGTSTHFADVWKPECQFGFPPTGRCRIRSQ